MLNILPKLFYESPNYQKILVDGLSCVIYKKLHEPVYQKEGYVSTHAITLVLKGKLRVEGDNGMMIEVPENKMIFLPKGLYAISDIIPAGSSFEAVVFFFDEKVVSDFISSINLKCSREKCVSHLVMDYTERIKLFTESLLHLYGKVAVPPRELTHMKLFEFLHLIRSTEPPDCFSAALSTLNNKERKSLKTFMNENYYKPLSIEDYAYLTGRSLSVFYRDFKAKFEVGPKKWLIDKRLEKAYHLLSTNGHHAVSTVAAESGYENIPHFIKEFKKKYDITPKQLLIDKRKAVLI